MLEFHVLDFRITQIPCNIVCVFDVCVVWVVASQAAFGEREEAVEINRMKREKAISSDTFDKIAGLVKQLNWGFGKADVKTLTVSGFETCCPRLIAFKTFVCVCSNMFIHRIVHVMYFIP